MQDAQPSGAPVQPGDVLVGKYRVERVLGSGGMGVVVAARHLQLDELVALKFLLPRAADKPDTVARFVREARAAARIKSEHVARVTDVGTLDGGAPYIVMEHLEGRDLSDVLADDGPLAPDLAVTYVLQCCEAIAEAHALGIVHRDLKPSNLFVARRVDGTPIVKVLDFGIAKAAPTEGADAETLTATNTTMGSPRYMSPEQVRSARHVDQRSDIWSLGVILHELVAGSPPFVGESAASLLAALVMDEPRRLRDARPDAPEALERVVLRCLEKDPADRYADVGELARALAPVAPSARASIERTSRVCGASADDPVREREGGAARARPVGRIRLHARAGAAADANAVATVREAVEPSAPGATAAPAPRRGSAPFIVGGALLAAALAFAATRGAPQQQRVAVPTLAESTAPSASASISPPPAASDAASPAPDAPIVAPVLTSATVPARAPHATPRTPKPATPAPAPTAIDRRGTDRH